MLTTSCMRAYHLAAGGQILPQQARIAELEGHVEALHGHIRALEAELAARAHGGEQVQRRAARRRARGGAGRAVCTAGCIMRRADQTAGSDHMQFGVRAMCGFAAANLARPWRLGCAATPLLPGATQARPAGALQDALARAEAAEARVQLLEQQADNLRRQVALLEVRQWASPAACSAAAGSSTSSRAGHKNWW